MIGVFGVADGQYEAFTRYFSAFSSDLSGVDPHRRLQANRPEAPLERCRNNFPDGEHRRYDHAPGSIEPLWRAVLPFLHTYQPLRTVRSTMAKSKNHTA